MIYHRHLSQYVIRPVLGELEAYYGISDRDAAEELLMLTAAVGSQGGKWLHQEEGAGCTPQTVACGSLGIYGMEPAYVKQVIIKVLNIPTLVAGLPPCLRPCQYPDVNIEVCANLRFATALARLHYHFASEPLPLMVDSVGIAAYWRAYWNAPADGVHPVSELALIHATQDVTAAVTHDKQYRRTT